MHDHSTFNLLFSTHSNRARLSLHRSMSIEIAGSKTRLKIKEMARLCMGSTTKHKKK